MCAQMDLQVKRKNLIGGESGLIYVCPKIGGGTIGGGIGGGTKWDFLPVSNQF